MKPIGAPASPRFSRKRKRKKHGRSEPWRTARS
nr:MAG TPA: hypothetical protein [Caudoviricetes sp.]